ncbi:MAG: peptidase, partial [bacterium]
MTYCLGMRCSDGLIGIADTRLTSGDMDYVVTGKKIFVFQEKKRALFIMFSGLKSLGDEMIAILNSRVDEFLSPKKIYQGLDFIAKTMRELRQREEQWLEKGNLPFDLNCIVGGQFENDNTAQLFRIYPEGSWTRVRQDTPFELIGEVKYGKPLLD